MSDPERFNDAVEALLADRSPSEIARDLDPDDQQMLRMAQLIRGSQSSHVRAGFVDSLRDRIAPAAPRRLSRRAAFFSGAGALAAGLLAGIGIDRSTRNTGTSTASGSLRPSAGQWFHVADVADLPDGAVRSFTAGAVQGYLVNRAGNVRALSRICTHMGCALNFKRNEQSFSCPCHGAEFDIRGQYRYGPGKRYAEGLPDLPAIDVRINGRAIEVFGA
ncbi:MAG: Rieske (2Fe-2S) protein [Chloroflexota bacterium]